MFTNNQHITTLKIFDFDETLFRVPGYSCTQAIGKTPYEWFDSPKSLDQEEFSIRGIANVLDQARNKGDLGSYTCLVTHRVEECKDQVMSLLDKHNVKMNETYFLGRTSEKSKVVASLLEKFRNIDRIVIYEDSIWEIMKYVKSFTETLIARKVEVLFVFVDKAKVFTFDWTTASQLAKTAITAQRLIVETEHDTFH